MWARPFRKGSEGSSTSARPFRQPREPAFSVRGRFHHRGSPQLALLSTAWKASADALPAPGLSILRELFGAEFLTAEYMFDDLEVWSADGWETDHTGTPATRE